MKRAAKFAASLAVTVVCLVWTFKDTRWDEMWLSLRTANYGWLGPYFLILTAVHVCRTIRWGNLLSGIEKVPFWKLNAASGIGFMMLIVLPFRLGEFARPFLIAQRSGIRRSAAMTTVVVERIVDGVAIALLLRGLLLFMPPGANGAHLTHVRWGANLMLAVFGGGFLFLLFSLWQKDRAVALVRATAGRVSKGLGEKAAEIVEGFVGAMRRPPRGWQAASFFFFTALYWGLNGWGVAVLSRAFGATLQLSFYQGFFVLAVLVIWLMIPAAPGSAGTFHFGVVVGLSLFLPEAVVAGTGKAFTNVLWVCQIGQQVLFGLVLMLLGRESFGDITRNLSDDQRAARAPTALPRANGRSAL